eukprot:m.267748 g.267748  ORF g.267748 m.267748 type:complete len:260 (-) comp17642_c0_seq7:961-1740(-)
MASSSDATHLVYFDDFRDRNFIRKLPSAPLTTQPRRRSRRRLPSVPDGVIGRRTDAINAAIRERVNESLRLTHQQARAHENRFQIQGAGSPLSSRRNSCARGSSFSLSSKPSSPSTRLRSLTVTHNDASEALSTTAATARLSKPLSPTPSTAPPAHTSKSHDRHVEIVPTQLPRFWQHHLPSASYIPIDNMLESHLPDEGAHVIPLLDDQQHAPDFMELELRQRIEALCTQQREGKLNLVARWDRKEDVILFSRLKTLE